MMLDEIFGLDADKKNGEARLVSFGEQSCRIGAVGGEAPGEPADVGIFPALIAKRIELLVAADPHYPHGKFARHRLTRDSDGEFLSPLNDLNSCVWARV